MRRNAAITAVLFALAASLFWLFSPSGTSRTMTVSNDGQTSTYTTEDKTLLESQGGGVLIVLAIPVALTAVPLITKRHGPTILAAAVLTAFCFLGAFTVGLVYVPAAIALFVAAIPSRPPLPDQF